MLLKTIISPLATHNSTRDPLRLSSIILTQSALVSNNESFQGFRGTVISKQEPLPSVFNPSFLRSSRTLCANDSPPNFNRAPASFAYLPSQCCNRHIVTIYPPKIIPPSNKIFLIPKISPKSPNPFQSFLCDLCALCGRPKINQKRCCSIRVFRPKSLINQNRVYLFETPPKVPKNPASFAVFPKISHIFSFFRAFSHVFTANRRVFARHFTPKTAFSAKKSTQMRISHTHFHK